MTTKLLLGLLSVLLIQLRPTAQTLDSLFIVPDTARVFSLDNVYQVILDNHPVAKQASLLSEVARQEIRLARGNFDPKIEAQLDRKKFNDKTYYDIFNTSIKFPTLFPLEPTIGLDRNKGQYLNPERYIDNQFNYRQLYAGVSLPLGRGLITDDRRIALRQAELFRSMTEADQVKMLNKLMLDAAKSYWTWYESYFNYRLLNRSVRMLKKSSDALKLIMILAKLR
jgi:outer membrane protein TolC